MTAKVWAIGKKSETIALQYGANVSKGIVEMEATIQVLKHMCQKPKSSDR